MALLSVIQVYDNLRAVENALRTLDSDGISMDRISVMTQRVRTEPAPYGDAAAGHHVTAGAGVSSPLGLLAGAVSLWIPGFGLLVVTGPVVMALLESVGDASSGLPGVWSRLGIPRDQGFRYEQLLKDGQYLLVVSGAVGEIYRVLRLVHETCAVETHVHALSASRAVTAPTGSVQSGWNRSSVDPDLLKSVRRNVR